VGNSNLHAFTIERVAAAIVTAIGHTDDRLLAEQVADVATTTRTAAGEYIVNSREEFLASAVEPLEQQLEAACETLLADPRGRSERPRVGPQSNPRPRART